MKTIDARQLAKSCRWDGRSIGIHRLAVAMTLISVIGLSACAKPEAKAQSYYESAMALIEKKQDVAARLELFNALKYKSDKIEAWRALAGVDERTGDLKGLFRDVKRVTELDPTDTNAKLQLARLMVQAGAADPAAAVIDPIDDSTQPIAELHALRALIHLRQKDTNAALAEATKAIAIDPKNKDALLILASEKASKSDFGSALAILENADSGDPDARLSATKVQIFERQGDFTKAEAELKRLIEANPKEVVYHAQLARLYMAQRRNDDAERELRAVAQLRPADSRAELDLVRFLAGTKGQAAAQQELEAKIKLGGAVFDYQLALADIEFAQGNFDQAKALLQLLISAEKSPANIAAAQNKLATLYVAKKDLPAAENIINEILGKDRRNIAALKLRAALRLSQGRSEDAIADLREAINDQPKAPDLLLLMAQAYEAGGKKELADRQFNDAIKSSNHNPQVGSAYVAFLQRTANPGRAEEILIELASRNPQNVDLLTSLARLRLSQKNWTGANQVADAIEKVGGSSSGVVANEIRAAVASGQNNPDETIAALQRARAASPNAGEPVVGLVNVFVQQKQFDKALEVLQDVQSKFPDNAQLWVLKGQVQQVASKPDDAEKSYQTAIDKQPSADVGYRALSALYAGQKRYDDAIKVVDDALKQTPFKASVDFRLSRAGLIELKGDHEGAIKENESILQDQPESLVAINNLASMLIDYRTDKASLDRARELADKLKGSKVPQFQDTVGWALFQQGDYAGASAVLEQAKAQLPGLAAIRYHLGMAYRSQGQKDKASAELKSAMDLEPDGSPLKQKIQAALNQG